MRKRVRNYAIIAWMAFLMAIVAEGLFFSLFNPDELALATGRDWDALSAYSIGFFCFWGSFAVCGLLAVRLTQAVPGGRPRRFA
ncbi:MAG: hypothetical protein GAK35_01918 [Herbaspirillum frisingense]|uniref:Uncharacterized protein n=1 Tax=Herbaspirillum frisingense TaxID=92645 RepID=A0A7V8FX35_9BURK|nr:MAG: hypothetical protein GAK35_01918 [Herbaspirillum frisingense]